MAGDFSYEEANKRGKQVQRPAAQEKKAARLKRVGKEDAHETAEQPNSGTLDAGAVARLQQTIGNAAVQRLLAQRRGAGAQPDEDEGLQAVQGTALDDETAQAINRKRGGGQTLDEDIAAKAGSALGNDAASLIDDVRVHTDEEADRLSQELGARAFTTGNDIFFRDGAYSPASEHGQKLIAHELAHVVQQGGGSSTVQDKMKVNDPNDQFEAQADAAAESVMNQSNDAVAQRQEMEEEEEMVQRQELAEEEEETLQTSRDS